MSQAFQPVGVGPAFRPVSSQRRGVVLILVVALLGILFVAGAALLNSVTFSAKTNDSAKLDRENRSAVEGVDSLVLELLESSFLGPDGLPYNPVEINARGAFPAGMPYAEVRARWAAYGTMLTPEEATILDLTKPDPTLSGWRTSLPTYGEIPGVHMWVDLTEPEESIAQGLDNCTVRMYSNIPYARARRARIDPRFRQTQAVINEPVPNPVRGQDFLPDIALETMPAPTYGQPEVQPELIQDSDGDGVPDTYAFRLSAGMLSSDLQRRLADRLRDPLTLSAGTPDLDSIWVSMRIVPHGAMANVNTRIPCCQGQCTYQDVLLASVLGYDPQFFDANLPEVDYRRPFLPFTEEASLRNRGGCVVARSRQVSNLAVALTPELFQPHAVGAGTFSDAQLQSSVNRRWWPYDASTLATQSSSEWRQLMDPVSGVGAYDLNHVLTTVSYDDQLIRSGSGPNPVTGAGTPVDWIEQMKGAGQGAFPWVGYPAQLPPEDVRRGRLKFSLAYFSKYQSDGGFWATGGSLNNLTDPQRPELIRIAQDAFTLLLRNYVGFVDFDFVPDPNGFYWPGTPYNSVTGGASTLPGDDFALSVTAASLAANLVDYADGDDLPTPVVVRDWRTGDVIEDTPGVPVQVYGFERQPFITEVYAKVAVAARGSGSVTGYDPGNTAFAVELYNPYEFPLDLTGYRLTDITTDPLQSPIAQLKRLGQLDINELRLDGEVIPPRSYLVLINPFLQPSDISSGTEPVEFADSEPWGIDHASRIQLIRTIAGVDVTVDEFDVSTDTWRGVGVAQNGWAPTPLIASTNGVDPEAIEVAWERDSTVNGGGFSNWRFVVPRAAERLDRTPGHTLGLPSEYDSAQDVDANGLTDPIRSVHLDVANFGDLRSAFPTTGSLLLLTRHAHRVNSPGTPGIPFNRAQNRAMALEYFKIDNGRLPVFDEPARLNAPLQRVPPSVYGGAQQGVEALPWGQLVFDYFTALPLDSEDPCAAGMPTMGQPPVDQNGLRVAGRINVNVAPWSVIGGLPLLELRLFHGLDDPADVSHTQRTGTVFDKLKAAVFEQSPRAERYWNSPISNIDDLPADVGREIAQSVVAYRDARLLIPAQENPELVGSPPDFDTGVHQPRAQSFEATRGPTAAPSAMFRRGYGFLTVGELLNVRVQTIGYQPSLWAYSMDGGELLRSPTDGDYIRAVARMVAMGDWVTTKSHVFTVYGTIRGQFLNVPSNPTLMKSSLKAVDQRAIRFQTTIDRLPMLFGQPAQRIGSRTVGNYADVRSE